MDTFKPFQTFSFPNVILFQTSRYEEYKDGVLISSGETLISIKISQTQNGINCLILNNNLNDRLMSCNFDSCITLHDRILMMSNPQNTNANIPVLSILSVVVGFTCDTRNYLPIEPVVGSMEFSESVAILSTMSLDQKRFVCGYMATIMAVDYDISDKELALWKLMSVLCGFPETNIQDAIKVYSENYM